MKAWAWCGMVAVAAFAMALSLAGCGEKASEKMIEEALEAETGTDVDVDISGDSITISGTDVEGGTFHIDADGETGTYTSAEGELRVQAGDDVELPADFPEDVPTYAGMKLISAMTDSSQDAIMITATTSDPMDKVTDHFKREAVANGWAETMSMPAGDMMMLQFSKNDRALSVAVMKQGQDTTIQLTVATQ